MKHLRFLVCLILCIMCLTGCDRLLPSIFEPATEPIITEPATEPSTEPATEPVTEPTEPATEPATKPLHSEFYIPDLAVEDVIRYFNEVCLDAEFSHAGDATLLQKWNTTIYYRLNGEYTDEDYATFISFCDWLNTIDGFPGIYAAEDNSQVNMRIYFCTQEVMLTIMGDTFIDTDGCVTYWYENDEIYDADICYRTDLDQYLRNSVILEEIYNGLGPIQDTQLRPDSIIYAAFSQPQALTEIDELILRLLYHPDIKCGMTAEECENVIRSLYY